MHKSLDREGTRRENARVRYSYENPFSFLQVENPADARFPRNKAERRRGETRRDEKRTRGWARQTEASVTRERVSGYMVQESAGERCKVRDTYSSSAAGPASADYSNTTEERPQWDGSLNATMLPPVWVERAGSESARLGRARPLSDLVDMPIDTVYMSMDMPCRSTLSYASKLDYSLLSSVFYSLASRNWPPFPPFPLFPPAIFFLLSPSLFLRPFRSFIFIFLRSFDSSCFFGSPVLLSFNTDYPMLTENDELTAISVGHWIGGSGGSSSGSSTGDTVDVGA